MKTTKLFSILAVLFTALTIGLVRPAVADEPGASKTGGKLAAFWMTPKADSSLALVMAGQKEPVTTIISSATLFSGICLDCNLPMTFKPGDTAKVCYVCGCAATNAACIVGKPLKSNNWQTMLKMLPQGTGLFATFNEADKPESGLKQLEISLRQVLLPVSGLESQTPDQLLALVKPLGGTKAELLDAGKLLSFSLKADWTTEKAAKLEKALTKLNAKIVVPEEAK